MWTLQAQGESKIGKIKRTDTPVFKRQKAVCIRKRFFSSEWESVHFNELQRTSDFFIPFPMVPKVAVNFKVQTKEQLNAV